MKWCAFAMSIPNGGMVELRFFVVREYQKEIENRIFRDMQWADPEGPAEVRLPGGRLDAGEGSGGGKTALTTSEIRSRRTLYPFIEAQTTGQR